MSGLLRICLCGVEASQKHDRDCPYPEYGTGDAEIDRWSDAHAAKYRARVAREVAALRGVCPDCGNRRFLCNEGCGRLICGCYHSCGRAS